ncbi:UdgX family uracil-DNA binding protein [Rhodobacteraceae bacterium]|nr:UdgX family uracil-DNA binding protein [Paracoccaceae bacterium]
MDTGCIARHRKSAREVCAATATAKPVLTQFVTIPKIGAAGAFREKARRFLNEGVPPEEITWGGAESPRGLFDTSAEAVSTKPIRVPRSFLSMAETVVWHSDADRFARLYALLWRLKNEPHLMSDRGDATVAKLRMLEKNVHRCQQKMKAFVRFREISEPNAARRSFAAWFEPTHFTVEPTAPFFQRRFADMDWRIVTPDVSAIFVDGYLRFEEGAERPALPDDTSEGLWITYFQNIFNPARVKVQAMTSEMPRKYWKNLPEAASIPQMIAEAPARARKMAEAAPTLPPARMQKVQAGLADHNSAWTGLPEEMLQELQSCTRCPLYSSATQAVPGEGPEDAALFVVGEQPGDQEDLHGRPFVGPAGQLFDVIAQSAGLDRSRVYVTNAVKHFKFTPRGKRRIHQRPNSSEVLHCRWWLGQELDRIKPKLVIAMGSTAALALTGSGEKLLSRRGSIETTSAGLRVLVTVHPAYLLRLPDNNVRAEATEAFRGDLVRAVREVSLVAT